MSKDYDIPAEEIERLINLLVAENQFSFDAYYYLLSFFYYERHRFISGSEFCWQLREQMLRDFGGQVQEQLDNWSIRSTSDIGKIVKGLATVGLVPQNGQYAIEDFDDFHNVFEFDWAFAPRKPFQWKLSTLFLFVTACALGAAGAARWGVGGAILVGMGVCLGSGGVGCIYFARKYRERGSFLALILGAVLLVGAAAMVMGTIFHAL